MAEREVKQTTEDKAAREVTIEPHLDEVQRDANLLAAVKILAMMPDTFSADSTIYLRTKGHAGSGESAASKHVGQVVEFSMEGRPLSPEDLEDLEDLEDPTMSLTHARLLTERSIWAAVAAGGRMAADDAPEHGEAGRPGDEPKPAPEPDPRRAEAARRVREMRERLRATRHLLPKGI